MSCPSQAKMDGSAAHGDRANGADDHTPVCRGITSMLAGASKSGKRTTHKKRRELVTAPKRGGPPEEVALMAAFEGAHTGEAFMNETIRREVLPHRTIEGIKRKRTLVAYKNTLEESGNTTNTDDSSPRRDRVNSRRRRWAPPPPPGTQRSGYRSQATPHSPCTTSAPARSLCST